jgi:retron-type reverse transcriptase
MLERLSDPDLYAAAAERVRSRQLRAADTRPLCPGGPRLSGMAGSIDSLAQKLARDVSRGDYRFGPVIRRRARIEGKERALYVATPLDDIVLGALAQVLGELVQGALSAHVYSYRRGRSPRCAIDALRAYVRRHCHGRPDPRTRGLYVVRRDIRGYGDAIPSGAGSALWSMLAEALEAAQVVPSERLMHWLGSAFRPELQEAERLERPERGVPTGSPLQPVACNLYLGPVDRICESVPDAFYARYGDDMLFVHADPQVARDTMHAMDARITELGLELSIDKSAAYYFTGAGRPSQQLPFRGVHAFDYLGVRLEFRGTVGLKRDKLRALLGDVRARLAASISLLDRGDDDQRARTLCAVVNSALDPTQPLAHAAAQVLRHLVDDRGQLRDIDYKLTRMVAQTLSGRHSVRALRAYPPRRLREQAGLSSLVHARDRASRQRA